MCDIAQKRMDKKSEQLLALANTSAALAITGAGICFISPMGVAGYIGIILTAVGFIGAITFESLQEIHICNKYADYMQKSKTYRPESHLGYKLVEYYSFERYVQDNGMDLEEFINNWQKAGWNFDKVYEGYSIHAYGAAIQSREDVWELISGGEKNEE